MARAVTGLVLATALTVSLSGCGIPTDDEVHRIDPDRVPRQLIDPMPPSPTAPSSAR